LILCCCAEEDESFTRQTLNNVQKLLLQECGKFGDKAKESFKDPNADPDARPSFVTDGPAESLAMDGLLTTKLYENQQRHQNFALSAAVLDRNYLATQFHVFIIGSFFCCLDSYLDLASS